MNDALPNILDELELSVGPKGFNKVIKNLTKENRSRLLVISLLGFTTLIQATLFVIVPTVFKVNHPLSYIALVTVIPILGGGIGAIRVRKFLDSSGQEKADQETQ